MRAIAPIRNQALAGDQSIQETHVVCNIVAGVVTLVMACVAVPGWVRSAYRTDDFIWHVPNWNLMGALGDSMLMIAAATPVPQSWAWPMFDSGDFKHFSDMTKHMRWTFKAIGFRIGTINGLPPNAQCYVMAISYQWLAFPLTLLSAWLLISKPRQKQTPIQSVPEKAA